MAIQAPSVFKRLMCIVLSRTSRKWWVLQIHFARLDSFHDLKKRTSYGSGPIMFEPFALSMAGREPDERSKGFDRLSPNGT